MNHTHNGASSTREIILGLTAKSILETRENQQEAYQRLTHAYEIYIQAGIAHEPALILAAGTFKSVTNQENASRYIAAYTILREQGLPQLKAATLAEVSSKGRINTQTHHHSIALMAKLEELLMVGAPLY